MIENVRNENQTTSSKREKHVEVGESAAACNFSKLNSFIKLF